MKEEVKQIESRAKGEIKLQSFKKYLQDVQTLVIKGYYDMNIDPIKDAVNEVLKSQVVTLKFHNIDFNKVNNLNDFLGTI